jgi:hypothetical protein
LFARNSCKIRAKEIEFFHRKSRSETNELTLTLSSSETAQSNKDVLLNVVPIRFNYGKENTDTDNVGEEPENTVVLSTNSGGEIDRVRAATDYALRRLGDIDSPVILMDLNNVLIQFKRWKRCLPKVQPYYAVKCNPNPVLVGYFQSLGCDFDCATQAEIDVVVNQ